jgi:8-oxo-dGTP pyrophosphatase MutT (NUDIX family)
VTPRLAARALIYQPGGAGVLLGQRSDHDKSSPGKWALLGGKIDPYESPREAVVREVQEEAGVLFVPEFTYHIHTNLEWKTHFIIGTIIGEPNLDLNEHQASKYAAEPELSTLALAFDHETIIRGFLRTLNQGWKAR